MPPANNLTGRTFDRLVVLGIAPKHADNSNRRWRVQCSCKKRTVKAVFGMDLIAGRTTSCGCRHDEVAGERARQMTKHGHASNANGRRPSRTYSAWNAMKRRCTNKRDAGYRYYGAKGVRVTERWKDFENFLADLGSCPPGYELERKNPYGNYTPKNCIWATSAAQARNKRKTQWLTHAGISLPIIAWSERVGVSAPTLHKRFKLGWPTADILMKPLNREAESGAVSSLETSQNTSSQS